MPFRRILVALDASDHSLAALEAAVELAAAMKAELEGLYVEDVNLLRAASSPASREVRYPFVSAARLDSGYMERQLRAQASQARQALVNACKRRKVKCSFRITRGEVAHEVVAAAEAVDMLILGRVSRPLVRQIRLGSTALAAAVHASCCVLLLKRDMGIVQPVLVAYDGSPTARRALMIATRLARKNGGYLAVLIVADTPEVEYRLQAETADGLRRQGLLVRFRRLSEVSAPALLQALQVERSGTLVLSDTILHLASLQRFLDEVDCSVLLVRSGAGGAK
ncbi:MAG: universal stress protein [Anaerolineae bacterium]|nr:universal stress protein [Anaerolineae bacterium]